MNKESLCNRCWHWAWPLAVLAGAFSAGSLLAAEPPRPTTYAPTIPGNSSTRSAAPGQPAPSSPALDALVKRIVIEHAPRAVEKADGWGRTKEIVSGLDVRRDGWELRTHRRRKQVNDGTWKWYRCELVDPQRDLNILITPLVDAPDGAKQYDVSTIARLNVQARLQKWESGVRLASISGDADAVVRLDLRCRIQLELDHGQFPPDFVATPRVERAAVRLLDLNVEQISKLRGDLAEELGQGMRPMIEREIAHRQGELAPKLNAKLAARQKEFRVSPSGWIKEAWSNWWNSPPAKPGK